MAVECRRWAIEDAFENAKTELGLAHHETCFQHRHVLLVMLAFAMMTAVRHRANSVPPPKKEAGSSGYHLIRWSVQENERVAMRLAQRRIGPAHVIAWSLWRRTQQTAVRKTHIRHKP